MKFNLSLSRVAHGPRVRYAKVGLMMSNAMSSIVIEVKTREILLKYFFSAKSNIFLVIYIVSIAAFIDPFHVDIKTQSD